MSWFSQNYEKAAIGGAAIAALGFALLGWFKVDGVAADFSAIPAGAGNNNPAVANANLVPKAISSLGLARTLSQGDVGGRAVDLFTGIQLFISSAQPDKPLDPYSSAPIHPPIPNRWWIDHDLDPGFADSPSRDADDDGFTNLEEYKGTTDPKDAKAHPPLIAKLKFHADESVKWFIRPGYQEGDKSPFKYGDDGGVGAGGVLSYKNKTKDPALEPGAIFFTDGVAKNRFKYLGSVRRREMNKAINMEVELTIARIEDQKDNKKGTIYEILHNFPEGDVHKWAQFDRKAVLSLEAIGAEGKNEKIEENTQFGLPFDNPKKDYTLKKITPEGIEVEYADPKTGAKKIASIRKGAFPELTP
jgi:hypothetical protein